MIFSIRLLTVERDVIGNSLCSDCEEERCISGTAVLKHSISDL